jgi:hypothetical protein
MVVIGLGTQAGWGPGKRLEKPGGGLLGGGTKPGGGGGGVPFRSTAVLKPTGWYKIQRWTLLLPQFLSGYSAH